MLRPKHVMLSAASLLILLAMLSSAGCMKADASSETAGAPSAETSMAATTTPAPVTEAQSDPTPDSAAELALQTATVVRVVDGDTAHLRVAGGVVEKVRFIGVDTPESTTKHEPYGSEAAAYTKRVLKPGRRVFLETDAEQRDRYGRLLAYVWLSKPTLFGDDGRPTLPEATKRMFNAQLMRDGFAQVMTIPPNLAYQDYFLDLQREARSDDRGLWSLPAGGSAAPPPTSPSPPPPARPPVASGYIGNRNTMKFHRPDCYSVGQMNPANKVALKSRDAAIGGGYVPCKNCRP